MSLTDRLLFDTHANLDMFDPYDSPPNLQMAQDHQQATRVGITIEEDTGNIKECPCCGNTIHKKQLEISCPDEQLLFLGVGYPLFFKLFKYFGFIIFIVFVVSGSGFYFLKTLRCELNCTYFLQIPISDLDNTHTTSYAFDIVHLATSILILAVAIFVKLRIENQAAYLESKSISPQQYTVIVQNLPEELTEDQINEWSKQKFGVKPIIINFAYNLSQLQDAFEQRLVLTIRMNRMVIKCKELEKQKEENLKNLLSEYIKDTQDKIRKYDRIIDHYKHENVNCRKIGTAFLTYSDQKNVIDILNKHETNFITTIFHHILPSSRNQTIKYNSVPVVIRRAPAPREIIWQNLCFSYGRYVFAEVLALATMIFVLVVAFKIQLYFAQVEYQYRVQNWERLGENVVMDIFESSSLSVMIMLVNLLLRFIIKSFICIKRHYSYSRYQSSFCFYYSIMYIFNTCFMIYLIHIRHRPSSQSSSPQELPTAQRDHIFLYDIHILMLINSLSDLIYKIVDPYMWVRIVKRRYIAGLPPEINPYPQAYVNELWEEHSISNVDNYQYIFRVLVVTVWFAHAAPLGVLVSLLAYLADYWLTKYLLLRQCKKPETISKRLATPLIKSLPLLPLVYLSGVLQYVYKVSDSESLSTFILNFFDFAAVILITILVVLAYYKLKLPSKQNPDQTRYDEVEFAFEQNYDTENPMNRIKRNVKYAVYRDLKNSTLKNSSKIFSDLMLLSRKESMSEKQSQLIKIKKKKLRKLQTIQIELLQEKGSKLRNHNSYRERSSSDSSIED